MDGPYDLTSDDVAALLSVDARTIQRKARAGEIPHIRLGKLYRFNREEVLQAVRK